MNHKWKDNVCVNCGIVRERKSWKLLMAQIGSKDYYKYGSGYYYGLPQDKVLVYGLGFKRPDCDKEKMNEIISKTLQRQRQRIKEAGLSF
jgi:hypothetical protein